MKKKKTLKNKTSEKSFLLNVFLGNIAELTIYTRDVPNLWSGSYGERIKILVCNKNIINASYIFRIRNMSYKIIYLYNKSITDYVNFSVTS